MGAPPKFTAVWPETAFGTAGWRARAGSCESTESSGKAGSGRRASLLRPSKARHPHEASRLANPVVESYMTSDEYSDYRGVSYFVRRVARAPARCTADCRAQAILVAGLVIAPLGLLVGFVFRKIICDLIAKGFAPNPVRRRAAKRLRAFSAADCRARAEFLHVLPPAQRQLQRPDGGVPVEHHQPRAGACRARRLVA